jgi:hypothetical protein
MAFKLVIADVVEVPVRFTTKDGSSTANFAFVLLAKRLPAQAFRALAEEGDGRTLRQFLAEHVMGWRGQRLVVDDDGQPAEWSPEAFDCMLSLAGLAALVFEAYVQACGAQGKAKN